jgi:hypothetical protein
LRERENSIAGYRPRADRPKADKQFNDDYLRPKTASIRNLNIAALNGNPNCQDDPRFTSDDLPTDREAQLWCAGCPLLQQCRETAEKEHVAWGVWGAKVYGRALKEVMGDD